MILQKPNSEIAHRVLGAAKAQNLEVRLIGRSQGEELDRTGRVTKLDEHVVFQDGHEYGVYLREINSLHVPGLNTVPACSGIHVLLRYEFFPDTMPPEEVQEYNRTSRAAKLSLLHDMQAANLMVRLSPDVNSRDVLARNEEDLKLTQLFEQYLKSKTDQQRTKVLEQIKTTSFWTEVTSWREQFDRKDFAPKKDID